MQDVPPHSDVTINFPMKEYTIKTQPLKGRGDASGAIGVSYSIRFKGNTVVDISPRFESWDQGKGSKDIIQLYKREHYLRDRAPMKKKVRYVSDIIPEWY